MTKIKDIKTKKTGRKARITVKSIMQDVNKRINKKQVAGVMKILEEKIEALQAAKKVVRKFEAQIKKLENMDIEEIDTEDYDYDEN